MSLVFNSCRSMRVIEIETYNPSAITFPSEVKTIMIVNNSAQQPDNEGHHFMSKRNGDSLISVSADSMAYFFCMSLGKAIAESPLFADVKICEDTLRFDSLFYYIEPFTVDDVITFCNEYGVDAFVSLDKLFFKTTYLDNEMVFFAGDAVNVKISGELRVLWPGQTESYKVPFADSLSWILDNGGYIGDYIMNKDVVLKLAMKELSELIGYKIHTSIVPHWTTDNRWYYTSISSDWKGGTVYAAAEKWAEAEKIWEPLYNKANKWKRKARLSSNLALCNEMKGDFNKATEYAVISYNMHIEHDKEGSSFIPLQKAYIETLEKRKLADSLLTKQLKEID
jgi:hypothetical protein